MRLTLSRVISRLRASAEALTRPDAVAGDPTADRLVVVWGNCQAHYLAAVLAAQGIGLVCIAGQPFGFEPEHRGVRPFMLDFPDVIALIHDTRAAGRQVIYIEQVGPMGTGISDELRALADGRVVFPHIEMQTLWLSDQPRSQTRREPGQIRRRLDLDLAAIRRSVQRAGWDSDLADWIADTTASRRLFHTFNHPRGEVMARLHGEICRRLDAFGALASVAVEEAQADILAEDGLNFISHIPVNDAVVEALDLTWAREGWYDLARQAWTATLGGDHFKALAAIDAAMTDPDHDPHIGYIRALILRGLGRREQAHAAMAAMHRAFPANAEYARQWIEGLRNQAGVPLVVEPALFARYPGYVRDA